MLGKGKAEAITKRHIAALADKLRVHPADLEAISVVESGGFGWFRDGRMKILNEKHWVYKTCSKKNRNLLVNKGLARRRWISPKNGGYKEQNAATARYKIFAAIRAIDRIAAYKSISMGTYQIMGFNAEICGFESAEDMFNAFLESEANQLKAFSNFLVSKKMVKHLRARDFNTCEKIYNGGGLNGAYARRMKSESEKLRRTKWRNYIAGSMKPPASKAPDTQPDKSTNKRKSLLELLVMLFKLIFKIKGK